MSRFVPVVVSSIILSVGGASPAMAQTVPTTQATRISHFDPAQHMRVADVKPGMKGYGLSVFSGTKIERFELNVITVVKNFGPQEDIVLIRCLGPALEHSGVIAGMSGSPIFLIDEHGNERMIGALAYGWSLSKDPIAGVQPIAYMLDVPADPRPLPASGPSVDAGRPTRWSVTDAVMLPGMTTPPANYPLASWNDFTPNIAKANRSAKLPTNLTPMSVPLLAGGLTPGVLNQVSPLLSSYGLTTLQAGGGAPADDAKGEDPGLSRGSSITVPLVIGDLDLTALGTCTEVIGSRAWGFGHPFQNEGPVNLPMGTGLVSTIIPTLTTSFKLGGIGKIVGTLAADQNVAIAGTIGPAPRMIPMDVEIVYADGSVNKHFKYEVAPHPQLVPMLGTIVLFTSLASEKQLPQYHTLEMDLNVEFSNGKSLKLANTAVNSSPADLFFQLGTPLIAATENPFQRVLPTKISGTMRVLEGARLAQILDVNLPRTKFLPAETIKAFVTYRPFRAAETTMAVEMEIPSDLPDGTYSLTLSDWQNYLSEEQTAEPFRFMTENVDQVFAVMKELADVRRDALYVRLQRQSDGVAVGRTAMPRLPSSRRQVFLSAGRSNTTAFVSSSVKVIPSQYVFEGKAQFDIEVDRKAHADRPHKRDPENKAKPAGAKPTTGPGA